MFGIVEIVVVAAISYVLYSWDTMTDEVADKSKVEKVAEKSGDLSRGGGVDPELTDAKERELVQRNVPLPSESIRVDNPVTYDAELDIRLSKTKELAEAYKRHDNDVVDPTVMYSARTTGNLLYSSMQFQYPREPPLAPPSFEHCDF